MGIEKLNGVFTEDMIQGMFRDYVDSMVDKERHTKVACEEVANFDTYCRETFPSNITMQRELYDRMMDVAVEFEESGFIAGFKWALSLAKGTDQRSKILH